VAWRAEAWFRLAGCFGLWAAVVACAERDSSGQAIQIARVKARVKAKLGQIRLRGQCFAALFPRFPMSLGTVATTPASNVAEIDEEVGTL
jgi:hypothetical protein